MRIALITPFNPKTNFGGVERFVNDLQSSLLKRGFEVDVFYSSLPFPKFLKGCHSINLESQMSKIREYDLIHAQGWTGWLSIFKGKIPFLTTLHGTAFGATKATEMFHPIFRNLYNYLVASNMERTACIYSDCIVCVSKKVQTEAKMYYDLTLDKSKVIYNGVDTKKFIPMKKKRLLGEKTCLAVGRMDVATKGLDFLEGVAKKADCNLIIAGTTSKKISAKVERFEYADLPRVYNSADIFLQTSRYEGCSFALIEAMACGLPVVAFNTGGVSEIVRNEKEGFVVNFGDIKSMSNHIISLLADENLRKKIGRSARKRAEQFSLDNIVNQYIKLYKSMV